MNTKDLQTVTSDTLKDIRKYDIVTPDFFTDKFYEKAIKLDPDVELNSFYNEGIESILDKVYKIQKSTQEHATKLKENINEASVAISKKDEKSLVEIQNKIDNLLQKVTNLEKQLYIDELTKAYNRKWLFEKLLKNNRFSKSGTLTFLDIDKFKKINDTYGHVAGDKVLMMISKLTKKLQNSSTIRYGGDEFIIICHDRDKKRHHTFFENINKNLAKQDLKYQGNTFRIGISYGTVDYRAGENFDTVIEKVDKIMYEHKKARASTS